MPLIKRPKGMDQAYYQFIYVPVLFIIGLIIVSELIKAAIPNNIFRYFLVSFGLIVVIGFYYKDQLKKFMI